MGGFERYLATYAGGELLKKHSLNENGTWRVHSEDPNCDFGGHHHEPYLGTFKGKLKDVLCTVTEMPSFWTWGAGGSVTKIKVVDVDHATIQRISTLKGLISKKEKELEILKKELEELQ